MARLRTFVAVEASTEVRTAAERLIRKLSETAAGVRWVDANNLHLTLKFLGEVDEREIHNVCRKVTDAARSCQKFQVDCVGAGAFPSLGRPRTIWMGVDDEGDCLAQLQQRTDRSLRELGFPREPRKFHGHLTLGRVRYNRRGSDELKRLLEAEQDTFFGGFPVDELVVFSSELLRSGPQYTALGRIPLADPSS